LVGTEFDQETGVFNENHHFSDLPQIVQDYERYRATGEGELPRVDFRYLDSLGLGTKEWTEIALNAPWMMTRMNLNTFARHGVFKDGSVVNVIANRLRNKEEIQKARQFPYQLYTAYEATKNNNDIPFDIREALQDAIDTALGNVPVIDGQVHLCVDPSGSMGG